MSGDEDDFSDVFDALRGYEEIDEPDDNRDEDDWVHDPDMEDR